MKSIHGACVCVLIIALLIGCGGPGADNESSANPDEVYEESIKVMNELADAQEQGEPDSRIAELQLRDEELRSKVYGLKLSKKEQERLTSKFGERNEDALKRLAKTGNKYGNKALDKAKRERKANAKTAKPSTNVDKDKDKDKDKAPIAPEAGN